MKKRYSKYIKPLLLLFDVLIINLVVYVIGDKEYLNSSFLGYINIFWVISSFATNFYKVYRYTTFFRLFALLLTQLLVFTLGYFTYFTLFREGEVVHNQTNILVGILTLIFVFKFLAFYALKKYRAFGLNYRKVIVLGGDDSTKKIIQLFNTQKQLGYQYKGFFSSTQQNNKEDFLGTLDKVQAYVLKHEIDEIYCSLTELKEEEIKKYTKLANKYNRKLKLIPNANELYNKSVTTEYYGDTTLVLEVKKLPFEVIENRIIKRGFDIIFSILVCVGILSWLYPILWILIKLESKGPVIFKQKREGIHGEEFLCFKFRSMRINDLADKIHATKDDVRITKIGSFLRRTSIDELPQFFNVLLGDMSVVGPRPHMNEHSKKFNKEVANYMKRKSVKPGITGLAQISGYRGEIRERSDIKNRVRLDIFYIENWSFLLDMKIIFQTMFNVLKGEEKAY